jgi:hypothetical protein
MLSPATCCLVNPDKERTVEHAVAPDPDHNWCCSNGDCLGIDLFKD